MLNDIEKEFIRFISEKRNCPISRINSVYLETKKKFKFSSDYYRDFCNKVHELNKILYDDTDEKDIIDSYKFHELLHNFRLISYSFPKKSKPTLKEYFSPKKIKNEIIYIMKELILKPILDKLRKKKRIEYSLKEIAEIILSNIKNRPIIVDYGCGLAYISLNIAKINRIAKIYLVDIDCLYLDFTEYYFKKKKIDVEVIRITKDNLYPKLPNHNICIATEVFEHLIYPLQAFDNIYESLQEEGLLVGDFGDKIEELFHISPDLSIIREKIENNFQKIGKLFFKKIS